MDETSLEGMTDDEINERIVARTNGMNKHLDYLMMNQNYETVDSVNVATSVLSEMLANLDTGKMARKAIDTEAHGKIINITEVRMEALCSIVQICRKCILVAMDVIVKEQ